MLVKTIRETSNFQNWSLLTNNRRRYMAEILSIGRETIFNQSIYELHITYVHIHKHLIWRTCESNRHGFTKKRVWRNHVWIQQNTLNRFQFFLHAHNVMCQRFTVINLKAIGINNISHPCRIFCAMKNKLSRLINLSLFLPCIFRVPT